MSDLPGHDQDPDPAALDELRRAFGDEAVRPTEPNPVVIAEGDTTEATSETPATPVGSSELAALARGTGPDVDHEPTPPSLSDDVTPEAEPAPAIIRIGDDLTPDPEPAPVGGVISISVDDELPDPVYVEGNLDREGGGTIVIIENDESGDTLAPESERDLRRGIEPRLRERRVAVKRAQGRRRLRRVLLVVGVIVLVVGALAVLGSPLFAVREGDVEIYGAVYSRGEEFDAVVDEAVGTPVLRLDTTRIEDELEAIPWIEQAQVTARFPHRLTIDVRERAAVSTYQGPDGRFRVLDRDGRVLDVIEDGYPYAYVLVGGPDAVDLEPGEFAPQGYAAASELAKNLTSSVRGKVVRIDVVSDGSRLTIELDDGSTVFFGEARDILAKLVRLEAVFANGEDREPGLIDVSTSDVTR